MIINNHKTNYNRLKNGTPMATDVNETNKSPIAYERLLDKISEERVMNPHLKDLIEILKRGEKQGIDTLHLTPETAQISQGRWDHHSDHTDYKEHEDTSPDGPSHGDYCD